MLVVMAAWLATIPDSSVSASITIAITSAQLALAAAGLGRDGEKADVGSLPPCLISVGGGNGQQDQELFLRGLQFCLSPFPSYPPYSTPLGAASVAGLGLVLKTKKKEKGSYGAPETSYGAPESSYEAPESSYEAPESSYEAPEASYTAPETSYISPGAVSEDPRTQLDLQKGPNTFSAEDTAFFPSDNAEFFPQDNSEIVSLDETGSDAQKLPTGSPRSPKKLSLNLESESNDANNFPRQKRQRNTKNKHHPHLQPQRQARGGLMDLPRLTLQSLHTLPARYRDYAARMQRFRIGGRRNPQLEFRMRVRRSAEGARIKTQGSQTLDFSTLFQVGWQ